MTSWSPVLDRTDDLPLYVALADRLAEDVDSGRLAGGTRLPTHRDLADALGVTIGTISRAYAEAARRGLVTGEVGRGTFVRGRGGAQERSPRTTGEPGLVDLSQNHPPPPADPALRRRIESGLVALTRRTDLGGLFEYPKDGGRPEDREAGAEWIGRVGLSARPEDVLVSAGSQHGITTVLATLLAPGDLLLTEDLTYAGLKSVAALLHLKVRGLAMDGEGLRPDAFEQACRTGSPRALYLVPTLHNPTVATLSEERRKAIAGIARRHGVVIVEDDIHALLPAKRPLPVAALAPELTYYLMSTSKTLAAGLRVGYLLGPSGMFARLADSLRATAWGASPFMAALATDWIRDGTADALVADRRQCARERQERARAAWKGARFAGDPASFYVWLQLPEPWRSDTFAAELRARGLAVTPAETFLVGRGPVPHAVRICLGAAKSEAALERGLQAVAEALASGRERIGAVV
jgi:DNA-binding transcriptional MocR family regulator